MDRRLVYTLLPSVAIGCTLMQDLDGYASGAADSGTLDAFVPPVDSAPADTSVADTSVADTLVVDTGVADTLVVDTGVADSSAPDTRPIDTGSDTGSDVADTRPPPYRHTIAVDGINDFAAADKLTTTTAGFDAYVSWDDTSLYVGYVGADLGAAASARKWVLVYLDVEAGGTAVSEAYGTQQHAFPSGFAPEVYYALRTDESYQQLKRYTGSAWINATGTVTFKRNATTNFVEMKIPLSALSATPTRLGLVTFMLNEDPAGPWTWAGLWSGSFTDGPSPSTAPKTIANWLSIDLTSSESPNATANKKP